MLVVARNKGVYYTSMSVDDNVATDNHPHEGKLGWLNTEHKVDKGDMGAPTNTR
jgi:hypothetical protein